MGCSWNEGRFDDYKMHLSAKKKNLNAWELIELIGMCHFTKGINPQTLSMGINEVYQELVMDVIKQVGIVLMYFITDILDLLLSINDRKVVANCCFSFKKGYMIKKGHKRKNWTERWFELHLNYMSYYVSEDLVEQKGCISLDRNCCVEVKP